MSMKSIDLQFAVHKNDEAGIRQNQLMQKPRQDETILENQAAQAVDKDRTRSAKLEESSRTDIKDHSQKDQKHRGQNREKKTKMETSASSSAHHPDHPYKGHHIDLSL